jgi:type IV pilus assembly protein PilA
VKSHYAADIRPGPDNYVARSQISEAMAASGAVKTSITEFRIAQGNFPPAGRFNDATGGRYTLSVNHDAAGVITAQMRPGAPVNTRVRNMTFDMAPVLGGVNNEDIVNWNCQNPGGVPNADKYLPSGCQVTP